MLWLYVFALTITGTCNALSLPPDLPGLELAPNHTLQIRPSNTTTLLGQWPAAPFRYPINSNVYIDIISYPPTDPTVSGHEVEFHLIDIEDAIMRRHTESQFLPRGITFNSDSDGLNVRILFFAEGLRTLRRGQARMVVEALLNLTAQYGPRQIEWADVFVGGIVVSQFRVTFLVGSSSSS